MARRRWQPRAGRHDGVLAAVWGVGGPISQGGGITPAEAAAVLDDVASRAGRVELRLRHDADEAWLSEARQFEIEKIGRYVLDLAGGFDEVWQKRFRGTARTAVRKAERSGLDVEVDRSGRLLDVFYDLYEKSVPRWGAGREPLWLTRRRVNWVNPTSPSHLALIAGHFGNDCATWVAWCEGEPVAAIIVLSSGSQAQYRWGAMDKEGANPVRANELLHRLASRRPAARVTATTTWVGHTRDHRWPGSRRNSGPLCISTISSWQRDLRYTSRAGFRPTLPGR